MKRNKNKTREVTTSGRFIQKINRMLFSKMLDRDKTTGQTIWQRKMEKSLLYQQYLFTSPCTDSFHSWLLWQSTKDVADTLTWLCQPSVQIFTSLNSQRWRKRFLSLLNIVRAFVQSQKPTLKKNIVPYFTIQDTSLSPTISLFSKYLAWNNA